MISRLVMALLAMLLVALPAEAKTVRIGLFIGNNLGFGEDDPLTYAEEEAKDLARLFHSMGDMPRERSTILQGATASDVRDAMRSVEAQVREVQARGDDVMLIFYYSGHASRKGLHLQGSMLELDTLRRWLENSVAQVRVAFVDACESGSLARTRGGKPVEAIEITVDDALTMSGLAIISSTGPLSVARESSSFGGGVFSRALLSGLRGSADRDTDGVITLQEAYDHAFSETVMGTAAGTSSIQKPEFSYDMSGVGKVVLTRVPSSAAGLILPEELEGIYTVVSTSNGQVVARVDKKAGVSRRLALPAGRYVVRKVRREDVLLAELDLAWGGDRWINDGQMSAVSLGDPLARGGWSLRKWRLSTRFAAAAPVVGANPPLFGGELQLRSRLAAKLSWLVVAGHSEGVLSEWELRRRAGLSRLGLALSTEHQMSKMDVSIAAGAQVGVLHQHEAALIYDDDDSAYAEQLTQRWDIAPGLFVQSGIHVPVGPVFGLELGLRTSLYRSIVDEEGTLIAEGQATSGLTIGLGGKRVARATRKEEPADP